MPPVLNFLEGKNGRAVAVVRGGDRDGDILYLHMDGATAEHSGAEIYGYKYMSDLKSLKPAERLKTLNAMMEGIQKGLGPESMVGLPPAMIPVYKKMMADHGKQGEKIVLPPGSSFEPLPSAVATERQVYYIAAMSGSGKSHMAKNIATNYAKLYPDRKIYLVSKLEHDETLDNMKFGKPIRIPIQSLVDHPFDLEEARDSLVICDDWDMFEDTKQKPYLDTVQRFIESICTLGRHTHTSLIICSHSLTNYKKSRLMLNESHYICLYPMATAPKAFRYTLENYGGLDPEQIKPLKKLGRWVMVHKQYPSFIMAESTAYLTHDADSEDDKAKKS